MDARNSPIKKNALLVYTFGINDYILKLLNINDLKKVIFFAFYIYYILIVYV